MKNIDELLKKLDQNLQIFCPNSKLIYYYKGVLPSIELKFNAELEPQSYYLNFRTEGIDFISYAKFDLNHNIREIYPYLGKDRTFNATIPTSNYKLNVSLDSKIPIFASFNCETGLIEDIYTGDHEKNIAFKINAESFLTKRNFEQYNDYKFGCYSTNYSIIYKHVKTDEITNILGGWRIDNPQHEDIKNLIFG